MQFAPALQIQELIWALHVGCAEQVSPADRVKRNAPGTVQGYYSRIVSAPYFGVCVLQIPEWTGYNSLW